jgi:hypothetical protein
MGEIILGDVLETATGSGGGARVVNKGFNQRNMRRGLEDFNILGMVTLGSWRES